ncbi:hypothetical protein GGI03_000467 [Coemansia sp. RSA 2337]|nr:hypothetical protein H4S03_000997 [Coemansia sp. S3946]KAJ2053334.1 hypothetical protein H4S04_000746 [Coemansia sp. S16]KAJ2069861.1 hypothetical protein GGI08_000133 [Coemansia sp. S2]KAJ2469299.1 hypothetical protein GGI03_000467 [Coemansia sp. RSA 2337]
MSTHLSPAAQFAAAAAAEAEAEARALTEASDVPVDEAVPTTPFLAICPAAPPGYVAPEFPALETLDESLPEATICVCPPAHPAYVRPEAEEVTAVTASIGDENVARHVSAAAMFETAAVDSAVGSDDGNDVAVVVERKKVVDLADQELFPALGGSSAKAPVAWGKSAGPRSIGDVKLKRATEVVDLPMMQESVGQAVIKIVERSGARIDVSHNAVLATSTYVISGTPDAVAKAKREVITKLSPRVTQVVAVPAEARSSVVGVRGRGLQTIQTKTGAVLSVARDGDAFDSGEFATIDVSVSGDAVSVAAAVAMVEAAADKRTTRRVAFETVPRDAHALLVGKGGAGLRALQAAHPGVTLRIPGPLDASVAIGVAGERAAVQAACAHIREATNMVMSGSQVLSVAVAKRQHRFVVGDKGSGLRDIALATGCSVMVPAPRAASDQISVRGSPADLPHAVQMVLERAASLAIDTFDPALAAGPAYGRPLLYAQRALRYFHDRARFRRIESEFGAVLRVATPAAIAAATDAAQLVIEITAPTPAAVAGAHAALTSLFAAFPPHHFNGIDVEPHQVSMLAESVGRLQTVRSVYTLLSPTGGVLVVYEGFNPDVDRIPDAGERERKTRELLRQTLEEFRSTLAVAEQPVTLVTQVPVAQQAAMAAGLESLLKAASANEGASRVVLRFGSVASVEAPANSRVTPKKDDVLAADSVEVRGPADAAARVVSELERRVAQAAANLALRSFRNDIAVPQGLVARVVGRGGETLKKLRAGREVTIDVGDSSVRIVGTRADVDAVSAEISALIERLADETSETITVLAELHRALIGSGGKFVKRLGDKYHVRIQFPKHDSDDEPLGADEIRIRGGRSGVAAAKSELLELAAYEIEHGHTVKFTVPADCLPHVVGRAGSRIGEIKDASDTRIDLGDNTGSTVDVTIVGTRAGVAQARAAIEAVVAEQQAQADEVVIVPVKHHRYLIGAGGTRVRELVTQAGGDPDATGAGSCRVQFPRNGSTDSESVRLKGDRAIVEAVRQRIEELVAERERQVTVSVSIPVSQHAFVIGRGGSHLKQLQETHDVEINFPRRGNESNVKISGLPDNCEAASAALLALVREETKISVTLAQHQRLGGRTSALWRRMRSEFGVQVDAAHVDRAPAKPAFDEDSVDDLVYLTVALDGLSAEWILRGEASKLPAAVDAVNLALADTVESVDARLRVDPRSHRHIIGKQGAMIAKIRDATTCDVSVPARGSQSPWVSITGPRNEVDRAIEMINEAIEERA